MPFHIVDYSQHFSGKVQMVKVVIKLECFFFLVLKNSYCSLVRTNCIKASLVNVVPQPSNLYRSVLKGDKITSAGEQKVNL